MTCIKCQHGKTKRFGTYGPRKIQRYRCLTCRATFAAPRPKPLGTHYTEMNDAVRVVALLTEGMSIRATARLTGLHKSTILSLLLTIGENCQRLMDAKMRDMHVNFVQADEAHTLVHTKQRHLEPGDPTEWSDTYVWFALDSETKAILAHHVGKRDGASAYEFMMQLSQRITGKFQLTTDGLEAYVNAINEAFGSDVAYAQLVKTYGKPQGDWPDWYRPSRFVAAIPTPLRGRPIHDRISTSHVERLNLSARTYMRRMTRLCNGFSKSLKHLKAAVSLFVAWYNFVKPHGSLRVTPMMEAQISDHAWSLEELLSGATQI